MYQILGKKGRILVRFFGEIVQIVGQILENFSQIQMIYTLPIDLSIKMLATSNDSACSSLRFNFLAPLHCLKFFLMYLMSSSPHPFPNCGLDDLFRIDCINEKNCKNGSFLRSTLTMYC